MKASSGRTRFLVFTLVAGLLIAAGLAVGFHLKHSGTPADPAGGSPAGGASSGAAAGPGVVQASAKSPTPPPPSGDRKGDAKGEEKAPIPVSVAPIATGAVSSYISSTANLVPENEVKVLAESEGRVAELLVEEGQHVGRGQVLAQLVKDDAEIFFRKAQLRATNAKLASERAQKVVDDDLMSREAFDKVSLDNQVAQQELAEAQWRLDKTTIRAPFGGRVTDRSVKIGQHVRPGDTLFTVSDFDPLIARIYLPEKEILGLQEGREVRITLKAEESTRFRGRIRQISPVVDTTTGTVKVTVEAIAPPAEVRPGSFVTIDVVRETHPRALLLPREAVIRELQESYVFIVNGEKAEKRSVSLGLEEGGRIEALSGVRAGEQVIVAGQGSLKQGSAVKVVAAPEASDLSTLQDRPVRG
ncbi:MAG TPA: efflux RND transporter periplasmic adaptor subunit [Candidatus Polarisedimenticolia bacterium]|nr:efflux RND transporter periplasmic adaptor subunit [Candidatus Polarisedimenticolia bacterium]